jgi:hypothetical protein
MRQIILGACNDSLLFPCAMKHLNERLSDVPLETSGSFGMAVVMEKELILGKRPIDSSFSVTPLLSDLHTNLFVATHEHENDINFRASQTLPARYRGWIFTVSGQIPAPLRDPKGPIRETLPNFLRTVSTRKTHGASLFAWALARFYEAGFLERLPDRRSQCMEIIGAGLNKLREATGLLALPFSFAIANREFVSGFVGESGMLSHGFSGMRQCERCQDPFAKRRNKPHEHLRAHLLTTPMEGMSDAWTPLSPDLCYVLQANAKLDTAPAFN